MVIGKIRSAVAAAAVCFAATSASAAVLSTNDFEAAYYDFSTDGGEIGSLVSLVGYESTPSSPVPAPFSGFGSKYMALDTDDAMVWHTFTTQSADVYFDSYVKMSPCAGDFEYASDAKFVVFLNADTNLCVISGTAVDDRTPVTNVLTTVNIEADSWHRLTVRATAGSVYSFSIYLDGTQRGETFYSLVAGTTMSNVGLKGTGAIDDLVVRTTAPVLSGSVVATIDGEDFATVEDALAASNGKTVTLSSDHSGTVAVTKSGTYVVDKGSYTFGGVVGTKGSYVTLSTSGNIDTYTVKLLVTVWDGATAAYDFSTLTRTVGDITYTLNLNSQNTVGDDGAYVQIGPNDAQKAITLTANGVGAFSTNGQVTAIMKCSALNLTDNTFRGLIGLLSDEGGYYSGDNNVKIGIATGWNVSNGAGVYTHYIANGVQNSCSQNATAYTTDAQTICMTYNSASGTCVYRDGSLNASSTGIKYGTWMSPVGIVFGGMDKDGSSRVNAQTGMKIESIAVFSSMLSAEEVAAYTFPSETPMSGAVNVSDINALFGSKSEINVYLADGTTVTGDTTFNASTVHFISDGSFTLKPPAGNTATFDFSGIAGKPVVEYTAMPTVSGSVFTSTTVPEFVTDSTKWSGVIYISSGSFTDFTSNTFGNESSIVRLGNVSGWLRAPGNYAFANTVPVELAGTLTINNGNSANDGNPNRCTVFKKLSGSGSISANNDGAKTVVVIQDASEFTGNIGLNNKLIVFGDAMPSYTDNNKFEGMTGSIWVMEGASVTANPASGNWWAVGGIKVYGELRTPSLSKIGGGTSITTFDTGTFTLTSTGNGQENETDTSYARITGTGTLKYEGTGWRALSTNNFPTTMTLFNEQAGDLLLSRALTYTIGSFAGSKEIQGNYGDGARYLRVLQSKDTEWSGTINPDGSNRFKGLTVAPGTGSSPTGTLTLAGTQTQSATLTVESGAKVKLTGTWKGDVTVAGELSGSNGTITGDLTLSEGAALGTTGLTVSGATTIGGNVDVYLPAGTTGEVTLLSSTGTLTSTATFTVYVGGEQSTRMKVKKVDNALKVVPASAGAIINIF